MYETGEKPLRKFDIYNDQFDYYFIEQFNKMTPDQLASLPKDLAFKIKRYSEKQAIEQLTHNEKTYILSVACGKRGTLVYEDDEKGLNWKEFHEAAKAHRGKMKNGELLKGVVNHVGFVLADKQLFSALLYLNHICTTNIYSLVKELIPNVDNAKQKEYSKKKREIDTIINFLSNYEANRGRLATDFRITIPEWFALIYFATGEKLGADFYNRDFKYSKASNPKNMQMALTKLFQMGLLYRRGDPKKYRYIISGTGLNLLYRIFDNILFKF